MGTADSNPLITVIIPVYNAEKYLRRGLESLLAQTCGNWEAVCIDDGSSDNSLSILKEYAAKDARFRVLTQENSGVSVARNRGIREARGEWVTFLDADDWLSEGIIAALLPHTRREKVDIIGFEAEVKFADDIEHDHHLEQAFFFKRDGEYPATPENINLMLGTCWGKAYRRAFLQGNRLEFPLGMRQEDEVFYRCSMGLARHVYLLKETGYCYYQNTDSYMHATFNPEESYLLYLRGMEIILDFYRRNNLSQGWETSLFHFLFTQLFRWRYTLSRKQLQVLRERSKPFLAESGFAETYHGDFRLRFLTPLPSGVEMGYQGGFQFERRQFMGVTYAKILFKDFKFERRVTPFSKLRDALRRVLPCTSSSTSEKN